MLHIVLFVACLVTLTVVDSKVQNHETCFSDANVPDCMYFENIKREIRAAKMKIWVYWKVQKYPKFLTTLHAPTKSWDIQKAKFIKLILNKPKNDANQTFVVGFSGSSVTAGHDNFFYEAYPNVFYEAMLPVMSSIGHVDFQVLNNALGNNPCYPYDACTETHFGDDLDVLTWEQTFNCGRGSTSQDTFARHADRMPKKPTVIYFDSGGLHWQAKDCVNITVSTPRKKESDEEKKLLHQIRQGDYKTIANNTRLLHTLQFLVDTQVGLPGHPHGTDPSTVFSEKKFVSDRFQHLAVMAQSFKYTEEYKCYGPYGAHFCEKTPGGGGGWHPGKEQHKMRGDTLAYGLLSIMEDAVQSIQDSVCVLSGDLLSVGGLGLAAPHPAVDSHRQLKSKDPEVPKSLQVPSSRHSALDILSAPDVKRNIIFHASRHNKKLQSEAVDEGSGALFTDHPNFRQSAEDILDHDHASTHQPAAVASTVAAGGVHIKGTIGGITTSSVAVPKDPQIPQTVIDMLGLRVGKVPKDTKSFALLSEAGSSCQYSESSKDEKVIRKNLRVAAYHTVKQYTQYYLNTVVNSAKVIPVPEYYNVSETNGPSTCYTDYEPRQRRDLNLSSQVVSRYSNWQLALSFFDVKAVRESLKLNRGYLDRKMLFSSNGTGSQIVIKVHNVALNYIWICQCQKGMLTYPKDMGDLHKSAEFFVLLNAGNVDKVATGKEAPPFGDNSVMLDMTKFAPFEVDGFGPMCYRPRIQFPAGDHILVIRQKEEEKKANIGYIVTF